MANLGIRSIQLTLGALALAVAGMACAQTTEAAPAMEMAKPAAKSAEMKSHKPMHKQMHKPMHKRDANPASREAAAAKAEAKRGKLDDGQSANQFERNAYARCQVFKTDIDRQACSDRVKQGAISGSVQDGGILRESTIEVPVGQ